MTIYHPYRHLAPPACLLLLLFAALPALAGDEAPAGAGDETRYASTWKQDCDDEDSDCPSSWTVRFGGGYLGVELTDVGPDLRRYFGAPEDRGVLVARVVPDSPAERAGLRVGDVVTAIDGQPVTSSWDLGRAVRRAEEGQSVALEVYRDHQPLTFTAEVARRDDMKVIDVGELVGKSLDGVDWENLGEHSYAISREAMEQAIESMRHVFENQDWSAFAERFEHFDQEALEKRMEELQERLKELERRIEERYGEKPDGL
ncbi:MAG: PDZ domain-containing protein [Acidobacteria bacterium]|nr:MAG: PDZ domain-containing protein [Acidobacteriota bacterium]